MQQVGPLLSGAKPEPAQDIQAGMLTGQHAAEGDDFAQTLSAQHDEQMLTSTPQQKVREQHHRGPQGEDSHSVAQQDDDMAADDEHLTVLEQIQYSRYLDGPDKGERLPQGVMLSDEALSAQLLAGQERAAQSGNELGAGENITVDEALLAYHALRGMEGNATDSNDVNSRNVAGGLQVDHVLLTDTNMEKLIILPGNGQLNGGDQVAQIDGVQALPAGTVQRNGRWYDALPVKGEQSVNTDELAPLDQKLSAQTEIVLGEIETDERLAEKGNKLNPPSAELQQLLAGLPGRQLAGKGQDNANALHLGARQGELSGVDESGLLSTFDGEDAPLAKGLFPTLGAKPHILASELTNGRLTSVDGLKTEQFTSESASLDMAFKLNAIDGVKTEKVLLSEAALTLQDAKFTISDIAPAGSDSGVKESIGVSPLLTANQMGKADTPQLQLSVRQGNEVISAQELVQRFAPVMKQQLVTMVSQNMTQAEIQLDPPELGQMLVRIQVQGEQTQVQFHVAQNNTKELLEQAVPRLRELLQEQGMDLARSSVSSQHSGEQGQGSGTNTSSADRGQAMESSDDGATQESGAEFQRSDDGSIDYYA
ncbi:hypothetical protein NFHSH190041_12570 [Shewanella sp. NFH-SH190041]|uniref:flagellar hook-length control protein FliK n=1 Tax=Shewanella sp. NFH-SH190041 TaxID=2950245 RepID=UPI0021C26C86|nr:flagellar hook-length control protein FliK [Shewanella sp. NFH-SH190041]BDM63805.1 hypothetical protein NFHSH190041_12570 [Shewanella sp. NFH-SH190041]